MCSTELALAKIVYTRNTSFWWAIPLLSTPQVSTMFGLLIYICIFSVTFSLICPFSYIQYLIRKITHFQLKSSVHAGNLQPIMSGNLPPRLNQFNWYIKPFFFSILRYLQRILLIVNLKQHINPNLDFLSLKLKSYNIIRCFASSIRQCIILTSK